MVRAPSVGSPYPSVSESCTSIGESRGIVGVEKGSIIQSSRLSLLSVAVDEGKRGLLEALASAVDLILRDSAVGISVAST